MYENYFKEVRKDSTLDDKIRVVEDNIKTAQMLRSQIISWGGGTLPKTACTNIPEETIKNENIVTNEEIDSETNSLYDKISLLDISKLSEEEIITRIREIIGSHPSSLTINRIKLLLYKEYIIYSKMIFTSKIKEEIEELRSSIVGIKTKIEVLEELEELEIEPEVEDLITTTNNNIFFLLSDTGKVIALDSIKKNIPIEYYPLVRQMIMNLKEGKATGVKRLTSKGFLEIKIKANGPGIRLIFDKLSNGNYIIIDCFMKKVEGVDLALRTILINRSNQYKKAQKQYMNNLGEESFQKEHEGYLAEILTLLNNKALEGDEINEDRSI